MNCNNFKELTASDFHAWFLVYWASTRLGSSRDNNTNGSLSADVLKASKQKNKIPMACGMHSNEGRQRSRALKVYIQM